MSQPDADGVYRGGSAKRRARTELAMDCLRRLWSDAVAAVPFDVPSTGIGFGAVGSLARGQIGPSSDLDLVIIYEPHTINDQQLNELTNKLWYPLWDSGLDLDQSVRTRQQCEAVTDSDLPAAMGLAGCQADRRRYGADFGDGHVDSGTLASSGPQAAAGTAEFGAQATGRVRTTRLPEPARHQGGARRSARFGAGLRVDCVMACRPTARPV